MAFRNRHVGFVFQFHHLLPEFNALENVEMPLRIARLPPAEAQPSGRGAAGAGRAGRARSGIGPACCRAASSSASRWRGRWCMHPALLLADEPTGDLDEATADALHGLLREMHAEFGLTAVIATHNPRLAQQCDRVLRLEGGRLTPA